MTDQKRMIIPKDPDKLHELGDRLEVEIAERQAKLLEVRRKEKEIRSAEIYNLMTEFHVTAQEVAQMVRYFRQGGVPGDIQRLSKDDNEQPVTTSEFPGYEGIEIEQEETEDE